MKPAFVLFLSVLLFCCGNQNLPGGIDLVNGNGMTTGERILTPPGYTRVSGDSSSFTHFLRNLPLRPDGSKVRLYNDADKDFQDAHIAVIDMEIGDKDLLQCADACIRLRAEYLWHLGAYEKISFQLTNGFDMDYSMWAKGNRLAIKGNKTWWEKTAASSTSYESFRKYLDVVFMYAGTLSLETSMPDVQKDMIMPGDVMVVGGSPGHAVMIVDVAINDLTQEKIFLLAQGYMPAQEIHLIKNPNNKDIGPWYSFPAGPFETAEWTFYDFKIGRFQ